MCEIWDSLSPQVFARPQMCRMANQCGSALSDPRGWVPLPWTFIELWALIEHSLKLHFTLGSKGLRVLTLTKIVLICVHFMWVMGRTSHWPKPMVYKSEEWCAYEDRLSQSCMQTHALKIPVSHSIVCSAARDFSEWNKQSPLFAILCAAHNWDMFKIEFVCRVQQRSSRQSCR